MRATCCRTTIWLPHIAPQDQPPTEMFIAEVTTTDQRKTRYPIESRDDVTETRQGYKIKAANGEVARFSNDEVESISVVEE